VVGNRERAGHRHGHDQSHAQPGAEHQGPEAEACLDAGRTAAPDCSHDHPLMPGLDRQRQRRHQRRLDPVRHGQKRSKLGQVRVRVEHSLGGLRPFGRPGVERSCQRPLDR
jgi:hypothetical protein